MPPPARRGAQAAACAAGLPAAGRPRRRRARGCAARRSARRRSYMTTRCATTLALSREWQEQRSEHYEGGEGTV